ncbi:MAG: imidazoleglycerol-phosphate dehydratase HisB [bacterium]
MRKGTFKRKTKETEVYIELELDGEGKADIQTPIGFLNHMLELFTFFSKVNLTIKATGDINVDFHHTVEDIGIGFGEAFSSALIDKKGIHRFGSAMIPMDEALSQVVLDISGRPFIVYRPIKLSEKIGEMDSELFEVFFQAFAFHAKITLHVNMVYGDNSHHIIESCFKGLGMAIREAIRISETDVQSTKGVI